MTLPIASNTATGSERYPILPLSREGMSRGGGGGGGGDGGSFEEQARWVLEGLRGSLVAVLEKVPGGRESAAELRRVLDLDAALSWQIHTLASGEDVFVSGKHVPKPGAMERFFMAAESLLGIGVVVALRNAYEAFGEMVQIHAGDRATFDAMLSGLRPMDGGGLLRARRDLFKANVALFGLRVKCAVNCVIFRERPTGEHDCLCVRGRVGVEGLSPHSSMVLYASTRTWGGPGPAPEGVPNVTVDGCEMLTSACSQPLPRVERRRVADGTERDFVAMEGLGRRAETTVFWKSLSSGFAGGSRLPPHGCTTPCLEPSALQLVVLMVPKGWTRPETAKVKVTPPDSRILPAGLVCGLTELPVETTVEHLGQRLGALYCAEVPRLAEVIGEELRGLGWGETEFDVYRWRQEYPMLHSLMHVWAE